MKKYKVEFTKTSKEDLLNLADVINEKYKAPLTAKKYTSELIKEINKLRTNAQSIPLCRQQSILSAFGYNARRINYKKMAIIYTIFSDLVIIEAIIPQANIKSL